MNLAGMVFSFSLIRSLWTEWNLLKFTFVLSANMQIDKQSLFYVFCSLLKSLTSRRYLKLHFLKVPGNYGT